MLGLTVEVRDANLTRLGQILPEDLVLSLTERFNNVGEWEITLPIGHSLADALRTPGAGIVITLDDGTVLASGSVVTPEVSASASDPAGTVKFAGLTDDVILSDRLAFPEPSNVDPTAQTLAEDVRTGSAESLMHAYVNANIGPSAPAARRDTRLVMGTDSNRGGTTTKRARFNQLGALLSDIAAGADYPDTTGRPLGFRVIQSGSTLRFETYAVRDQSGEVRFDVYNGSLTSHKVATSPPGATRVIVAGSGEGADRTFAEVTTSDSLAAESAWGRRIEVFKDARQSSDTAELTKAGQEELTARGFASLSVQATPADDTAWEFVTDWFLGDIVTVVVDGAELKSVISGYVLKADASGVRLGATLGDPEVIAPSTEKRVSSVEQRVSNLERTAEVTVPPPPVTPPDPWTVIYTNNCTSITGWTKGGGAGTFVQAAEPTATDGQVIRATGAVLSFYPALSTKVPYNPRTMYRIRVRSRLKTSDTVTTNNVLFAGFAGIAADGTTFVNVTGANSVSSQHYAAANNVTTTVAGGWVTYEGYAYGFSSAPPGAAGSSPVTSPLPAHQAVRYMVPILFLNYPTGTDGVTEVDSIEIAANTTDYGHIEPNSNVFHDVGLAYTNSTTTPSDVTGATTILDKQHDYTLLSVRVMGTFFMTNGATSGGIFNVSVNGGSDWTVALVQRTTSTNVRIPFMGEIQIPNVPAGRVTVQLRARLEVAGTTLNMNSGDFVQIVLTEIP